VTDDELSRLLTETAAAAPGVSSVLPTAPLREAAAQVVSSALDLPRTDADAFVQLDRTAGGLLVTAHVSAAVGEPTPSTLRAVAQAIRHAVAELDPEAGAVSVRVRALHIDPRPRA
jgi:hypothetical protein